MCVERGDDCLGRLAAGKSAERGWNGECAERRVEAEVHCAPGEAEEQHDAGSDACQDTWMAGHGVMNKFFLGGKDGKKKDGVPRCDVPVRARVFGVSELYANMRRPLKIVVALVVCFIVWQLASIKGNRLKSPRPPDCTLQNYARCSLAHPCGFGCTVHHVMWCMSQAREAGLTPVLDPDTFTGYWSPICGNRWDCYFEPFSPCQAWYAAHRHEVTAVRGYDGKHTVPGLTSEQKLNRVAALVAEILRPNARVTALLENQTFDVGVHIRRGDKLISEALYFSTNEYFNHVDNFVHPDRN